jgi:hypothetical protein
MTAVAHRVCLPFSQEAAPAGRLGLPLSSIGSGWTLFRRVAEEATAKREPHADAARDTLIKLLAPPGWIPESAGTTSILAALLTACGDDSGAPSAAEAAAEARAWHNRERVGAAVSDLVGGLFSSHPLQALGALLQVWDTASAAARARARAASGAAGGPPLGALPGPCRAVLRQLDSIAAQSGDGGGRLLARCAEMVTQAVRRRRGDAGQRLKYSEEAAVHAAG